MAAADAVFEVDQNIQGLINCDNIDYDALPAVYQTTDTASRDTLCIRRLPLDMQLSQSKLYAAVQHSHSLFRGSLALLCGKEKARVTFVMGHTLACPVDLSPGMNIFTWAKDNLTISPAGIGAITTFPKIPNGPHFGLYLDNDHYITSHDGSPLLNPVNDFYVLGTRPQTVGVVKPFRTVENWQTPTDWRLRQWTAEVGRSEWPTSAVVHFYDLYRLPRSVHVLDWRLFSSWPVLERAK
jgi:hypothetical protein